MLNTLSGRVTERSAPFPAKAQAPIVVNPFSMTTVVRAGQSRKAPSPRLFTVSGMRSETISAQPANASLSMFSTP